MFFMIRWKPRREGFHPLRPADEPAALVAAVAPALRPAVLPGVTAAAAEASAAETFCGSSALSSQGRAASWSRVFFFMLICALRPAAWRYGIAGFPLILYRRV